MAVRRLRSAQVWLSAAFLGLASGGVAACDSQPDEEEVFYCVDENETIVDEENCDDDRARSGVGVLPLFFLAHSSRYAKGLRPGTKLPPGGAKFAYNDAAARAQWGLPSNGRVANGTVKTGSVGKGGGGGSSGG
jgi:hypothetical protein